MKVINIFGGPGVGKSTTACGLFVLMKKDGYMVEYEPEYAKEKVYEKEQGKLDDQLYVFSKQHRKINKLHGQVDYVVTDAPLLVSVYYNKLTNQKNNLGVYYHDTLFENLVIDVWNQYENINILLKRNPLIEYQTFGRNQTEDQAKTIDYEIEKYIKTFGNLIELEATESTAHTLFRLLITNGVIKK